MDLKFTNQRANQLPSDDGAEVQGAALAASGSAIAASAPEEGAAQEPSNRKKMARVSWHGVVHAIISKDYIGVLVATVVLVLVIGAVRPDFLDIANLMDILSQATTVALLAGGMAFLLSMRELDLSVGAIYGLTAL